MKQYLYYFIASLCLCACNKSTFYDVQYQNKTGLILPKINTSIDDDSNEFSLDVGEKSKVFTMENTSRSIVGPPFISHHIKEYRVKDSIFTYPYSNLYDLNDFDKKKVNLIEIVIDTSKTDKKIFFRFKLVQ
jgi:hypothetical protein